MCLRSVLCRREPAHPSRPFSSYSCHTSIPESGDSSTDTKNIDRDCWKHGYIPSSLPSLSSFIRIHQFFIRSLIRPSTTRLLVRGCLDVYTSHVLCATECWCLFFCVTVACYLHSPGGVTWSRGEEMQCHTARRRGKRGLQGSKEAREEPTGHLSFH